MPQLHVAAHRSGLADGAFGRGSMSEAGIPDSALDAGYVIREAATGDVGAIIEIDAGNSGVGKPEFWREAFAGYREHRDSRFFLVAERGRAVDGFIIGEIRAWEFGSPPCGWVFVIGVRRGERQGGIGSKLMAALCRRFQQAGISKIRTMVAKQNHELLAFFRSQGMMAGPYQQLETDLD